MAATLSKAVRTTAEAVLIQIRRDIVEGTLAPGGRMRFPQLRAAYNVSYSTLREALAHLSEEGLVLAEAQRGYRVIPLSRTDFFDLYESRMVIERASIALALPRGDGAWEATLRRSLDGLPSDPALQPAAQQMILDAIVAPCGSPTLEFLRRRQAIRIMHYWQAGHRLGVEPPDRQHDYAALLETARRRDVSATIERVEEILNADLSAFDAHAGSLWKAS